MKIRKRSVISFDLQNRTLPSPLIYSYWLGVGEARGENSRRTKENSKAGQLMRIFDSQNLGSLEQKQHRPRKGIHFFF